MDAILGPPHSQSGERPSREDVRLALARKSGWPSFDKSELTFGRHFVVHEPSGDLFFPYRGEVDDVVYAVAAAYYLGDGGTIEFLQRPTPGLPQSRDELLARRTPKPAAKRVKRR